MKSFVRKNYWKLCFFVFLFLFAKDLSAVQNLEIDLKKTARLDSNLQHSWWMSQNNINITEISQFYKTNAPMKQHWHKVQVPGNIADQIPDVKKNIWLMKRFTVHSSLDKNLAINLGVISDRDKVYLNGNKIGETGIWNSSQPQAYDKERIYSIPSEFIDYEGVNVLLVQVQSFFPLEIGIVKQNTTIGLEEIMWRNFYLASFFPVLFLASYLTVFLYFFFLFLRRRDMKAYLTFAIFTFLLILYQIFRNQLKYEFSFDFVLLKRLEYISLFAVFPAFPVFIRSYFEFDKSRFLHYLDKFLLVIIAGYVIAMIITIFTPVTFWNTLNSNIMLPFFLPAIIVITFSMIVYQIIQKNRDAVIILFGFFFVFVAGILDALNHYGYLNIPRTMGFAFFVFVIGIAIILADRFVRLHNEVEELNKNLEEKVQRRTAQLNDSLQEVQNLKTQQDGDYFLTSLLIEPLSQYQAQSPAVTIETLLKSKKEFSFRKWQKEIGGDINIAHNILLSNREVTIFLNGDAMGKSMQGAGGVLVLGSVFASIIERTKTVRGYADVSPEFWLKNTFLELNQIFETFEGSMMMSVAMGIVDDSSGLLYYINAEHPFSVLYRNQEAEFIENDIFYRKLGMPGFVSQVQVKVLQLQKNDVLICGSDGRDDILLGLGADGVRVINEDENQFLHVVQKTDANLLYIKEELLKIGELTDDLSLLKIHYHGQSSQEPSTEEQKKLEQQAEQLLQERKFDQVIKTMTTKQNPSQNSLALLVQAFYGSQQYAKAAKTVEQYLNQNAFKNIYLFIASSSFKHIHQFQKAIQYGERLFLRDNKHINNLINLADCYQAVGDFSQSKMLMEQAEQLDPQNLVLQRLKNLVEKKAH